MDPKKFKKKTKRASATTTVKVKTTYLDRDYKMNVLQNNPATSTGLLKIVELNPQKLNLPQFVFRWDEKAEKMDIDIYADGKLSNSLWKKEGYRGHHPKKVSDGIFEVHIDTPNRTIFIGEIDASVLISNRVDDEASSKINLTVCKKVNVQNHGTGKDISKKRINQKMEDDDYE